MGWHGLIDVINRKGGIMEIVWGVLMVGSLWLVFWGAKRLHEENELKIVVRNATEVSSSLGAEASLSPDLIAEMEKVFMETSAKVDAGHKPTAEEIARFEAIEDCMSDGGRWLYDEPEYPESRVQSAA